MDRTPSDVPHAAEELTSPPSGIPLPVWALAVLLALLACWPFVAASRNTPEGWQFTGVVHPSPDFVQYRVWMRQSLTEGPIVTDRFTTEPNHPHLPVFFYYVLGQVAHATGTGPEAVMAFAAAPLAVLFVLLVYAVVRQFLSPGPARAWALLAVLLGGGLGAYLKELRDIGLRLGSPLIGRLVGVPMREATVFEDLRGTYPVTSLFDSHFLLIWLLTTAAILGLYRAVTRPSLTRTCLAAILCIVITLIHVYEGVLLLAILGTVIVCFRARDVPLRPALVAGSVAGVATLGALAMLGALQRHSGLPMPEWRGEPVLLTMFLAGFPLQILLILPGLKAYWARADESRLFLLGWAVGCLLLTFSGPFYPWPARGLMTLAIPLTLIAADVYTHGRSRPPLRHAIVAILLLGFTPIQVVRNLDRRVHFRPDRASEWLSPEHRQIVAALRQTATPEDVLLAPPADVLWLAPEFPGRHFAGHFFLTVGFARKVGEISALREAPAETRELFLRRQGITLLFVPMAGDPAGYRAVNGVTPLAENSVGALYRVCESPLRGC